MDKDKSLRFWLGLLVVTGLYLAWSFFNADPGPRASPTALSQAGSFDAEVSRFNAEYPCPSGKVTPAEGGFGRLFSPHSPDEPLNCGAVTPIQI
jgi:hypothetical protein